MSSAKQVHTQHTLALAFCFGLFEIGSPVAQANSIAKNGPEFMTLADVLGVGWVLIPGNIVHP